MLQIDLNNKIAIVTGASRGIGEAIARGLADCGAHVILTSRKKESLQIIAESINNNQQKATAIACHSGKLEEIESLIQTVRQNYGQLDILINNAATNPYYGPAGDISPEAFNKTLEVNLRGPYFMMSAALPLMIESGGGSMVNVASIAALKPAKGQAVYAMTKAGLVSLTESFANEYGHQGIRVNAILPGIIETQFAQALIDNPAVQKLLSRIPAARAGKTKDMVAGVLYLVSEGAAYTTGASLVMDGGTTISI